MIAPGISAEDLFERFSEVDDSGRFYVPGSSAESVRIREELLADAPYGGKPGASDSGAARAGPL